MPTSPTCRPRSPDRATTSASTPAGTTPTLPAVADAGGYQVVHVTAGPAEPVAKDALLPHMGAFAERVAEDWRAGGPPDVVHAHFWMSGLAAVTAGRGFDLPVVLTYHALGSVKRRHQGAADTSPARRIGYERAPRPGGRPDRRAVPGRDP